jgi:O-antigen/teichoic acid export membrane protein
MAFIAFPVAFGLAAIAEVIVPLIYGGAFAPAVPAATILLASAAVPALSTVASAVLYGMGRNRFFLIAISAAAAIMIVSGITVIPRFGLIGAAVVRMATQILLVILFVWYINRRLGYPTPLKHLALIVLSALLCAAVAFALVHHIDSPYSLVAAIPLAAFVYLACVRALGALPREDVEKLKRAFNGLPAPIGLPAVFVLGLLVKNPRLDNRAK